MVDPGESYQPFRRMFGVDPEIRDNISELIAQIEPIVRPKCHHRLGTADENYRRADGDVVARLTKPAFGLRRAFPVCVCKFSHPGKDRGVPSSLNLICCETGGRWPFRGLSGVRPAYRRLVLGLACPDSAS